VNESKKLEDKWKNYVLKVRMNELTIFGKYNRKKDRILFMVV